jgi:hypothetical protein
LGAEFGFFGYAPPEIEADPENIVVPLFKAAEKHLGRIDGVVLPETALTDRQFAAIRKVLPRDCFLVSGLRAEPGEPERNEVRLSFPPLRDIVQKKHHPWKLTESQVIQYGLGGVLTPYQDWWELGEFTDRSLCFVSMSEDLVLSVLVCEDLARPDPVANIVRTVGPNLLIALLMDGPQIRERWAARYATVFAEDPGCSVLALTSIGMSQLSRPQSGPDRSRVVAIWKDRFSGATEIELPRGCEAIAISLATRYSEEFTLDGRGDEGSAAFPVLSGVHPIAREPQKSE